MKIYTLLLTSCLLTSSLFFCLSTAHAEDVTKRYAVSNIPKTLLINANAVIRADELIYTIENTKSSKVKMKHAITLLNENASDYARVRIPYNKSVSVNNIKATIYDSNGEVIYSAKPEIFEMSGNYAELATDLRYWVISFPLRKYPYTVEYEYEKNIRESFFYEDWSFQSQPDVSVQQSGAQYIIPKEIGFRVKELNLKHYCDTFMMDDKTILTWQEENIPAYKPAEQILISFDKKAPVLQTAPTNFNMGGYDGNMETWEAFGKWNYELNKNRDKISPELQAKLKSLIATTIDKKEQVKLIYEYLQKTTRYESIQLGLGGYQTLEASFVEKKGFGDCKALSNYMKAMLKSVDITAIQALVLAGKNEDIQPDFPSQQFNHVILCIPFSTDSIWLECTSQTIPFNFLGSFTNDRHVLLLTENGGILKKTPEYGKDANFRKTSVNVSVDFLGNAKVNGQLAYSGLLYEEPLQYLKEGKKEKEEWINNIFDSPNITVNALDYKEIISTYPQINVNCEVQIRDFVSKSVKRMVFNPFIFNPINYIPKSIDDIFSISSSRIYSDSIIVKIPYGYKLTHLPVTEKIETIFGSYQTDFSLKSDKVTFYRQLTINKGKYNKEDIAPFREFANKIAKFDRRLVVIEKE